MIEKIFDGWMPMLMICSAYAAVYLMNMLFGIYENVFIKGEKFVFKKTFGSVIEVVIIMICAEVIVASFNLLFMGLKAFDINVSSAVESTISIGVFIVAFIEAFKNTAKDVYEKIVGFTGTNLSLEEANRMIIEYKAPVVEADGASNTGETEVG